MIVLYALLLAAVWLMAKDVVSPDMLLVALALALLVGLVVRGMDKSMMLATLAVGYGAALNIAVLSGKVQALVETAGGTYNPALGLWVGGVGCVIVVGGLAAYARDAV